MFGGPLEFVNTLRELIPVERVLGSAVAVGDAERHLGELLAEPSRDTSRRVRVVERVAGRRVQSAVRRHADVGEVQLLRARSVRSASRCRLLGGGGFFAIGISAKGVQEIEAALEFGAALEIDLGVASGGVEIKAGVYFHWLEAVPGKGLVELAGYIRIHGELSVLGLISVSITFNLQLSYRKENHESSVWGEATLVVEVEVLFFSADVSVRCRKEFGGAESDPKFIDLIPDVATWTEYCGRLRKRGADGATNIDVDDAAKRTDCRTAAACACR